MLTAVTENLWYDEFDLFMPGKIHFRGRMTVIRIRDRELVLHSPIPIDDTLAQELKGLGEVRYIIAPNCFHHLHVLACHARYPDTYIYGAPGLDKKRSDIPFQEILGSTPPTPLQADFEQRLIAGVPSINEVVFFHRPSRSLIVTDLIFNIHDCANWQSRLLFRIMGAYKKPAQSRLWRSSTKDRNAAKDSVSQMLAWDFTRLIMAHGNIVEHDAKTTTTQALQWMLQG